MAAEAEGVLERRLRRAARDKAGSYPQRTQHVRADGEAAFVNRLVLEDSPYLLQHAHNPVNWYPWGAEAFQAADLENKPIFLSIGYSTCHWCHVMEEESFDNVEVATLLNRHFISIKMDREQYPDIDDFYMTGVQIMTGQGGWPMSNFLLADGKPFFAATYFPPQQFIRLLQQIVRAWDEKYSELQTSAASIQRTIGQLLNADKTQQTVPAAVHDEVLSTLYGREDTTWGGLAGAPKFPQEPLLALLLDRVTRHRDLSALGFVTRALTGMGLGGIHDQVGGGFHRYSVDEQWLVPHFEKMLYNQSQLGQIYCEAFRLTGKPFYRRIATRLFDYVLRDMQLAAGGFCSATDADSEGEEGRFFLWTPQQLLQVLGEEDARLITGVFQVTQAGNFEGANILRLQQPLENQVSGERDKVTVARVDDCLQRLYRAREQRLHPLRDDKLIVGWCAAMATALVQGSVVMGRSDWLQAAERAVAVMLANNLKEDGDLLRICLDGKVSTAAQLEDYANLIEALLALFDAGGEEAHLHVAHALAVASLDRFYDPDRAVFYLGPRPQSGPELVRSSNGSDGATGSAVATMLANLWHLARRPLRPDQVSAGRRFRQVLQDCLANLTGDINANPIGHCSLLRVLALHESGSRSPVQYAAEGQVSVYVTKRMVKNRVRNLPESTAREFAREALLTVSVRCAEGWYLAAPGVESSDLEPIRLSLSATETGWKLGQVNYPACHGESELKSSTGDRDTGAAVYRGAFALEAVLVPVPVADELGHSIGVELRLQVCGEHRCLVPETLRFVV